MAIGQRRIDDVVIIDIRGNLVLGDEEVLLRKTIERLLAEGLRQIVLNLSAIKYMDSSGVGELVSSFTRVTNQGGSLKLLSPTKRMVDFLQITKLYTVFEVYDDEAEAVRSFSEVPRWLKCPVCGSRLWLPAYGLDASDETECADCHSILGLPAEGITRVGARLERIRLQPYEDSGILLRFGQPVRLELSGRLNLFTASFLRKAWRVIPSPRYVLVDLRELTELDPAGADALTALLAESGEDSRIAVSLAGLDSNCRKLFPSTPPFFDGEAPACQALGDMAGAPAVPTIIIEAH